MASVSMFPPGSIEQELEQLHGRLSRYQRELSLVRGIDEIASNRRARLLRDIELVELKIRELAKERLVPAARLPGGTTGTPAPAFDRIEAVSNPGDSKAGADLKP